MRKVECERLILTRHFFQRWQERVGNWPTVEAIANYIRHSVKVRGCEDLTRKNGTPFRMLAIYWHPALDLVIKVDGIRNAAVTVLSMENWRYGHPNMSVGLSARGGPARHRSRPSAIGFASGECRAGSGEAGGAVPASTEQLSPAMSDRIKGVKAMFGGKTLSGEYYGY